MQPSKQVHKRMSGAARVAQIGTTTTATPITQKSAELRPASASPLGEGGPLGGVDCERQLRRSQVSRRKERYDPMVANTRLTNWRLAQARPCSNIGQ